jgi:hypothetical protein
MMTHPRTRARSAIRKQNPYMNCPSFSRRQEVIQALENILKAVEQKSSLKNRILLGLLRTRIRQLLNTRTTKNVLDFKAIISKSTAFAAFIGIRGVMVAVKALGTKALLKRRLLTAGMALCYLTALSACLNNNLTKSAGKGDSLTAESPLVGNSSDGSASSSFITLTRVVKSSADPSKYFDLIGDGTESLGQYCTSDENGANKCSCSYEYSLADGTPYKVDAAVTYAELNILRCSYQALPTGLSTLTVKIHLGGDNDQYSNGIVFNYSSGGTTSDPSNSASFVKAIRHQCRDAIFVPYAFDGNIYDPLLSEDPSYTYSLNFYSTNLGGTIASFVNNSLAKPVKGSSEQRLRL